MAGSREVPGPSAFPQQLLNIIKSHRGPINALAFSALGGTFLLSGSSDREIHLSRAERPTATAAAAAAAAAAVGGLRGNDDRSGPIQRYAAHGYAVLDLDCAADNQSFVSVGGDRNVFLWDVERAVTRVRFGGTTDQGHRARVNVVRFAGEEDAVVVSGSDDTRVLVWDCRARDGRPMVEMKDATDGIAGLWCPPDKAVVVSGSVDGRVRWYDLRMGVCKVDVLPAPVVSVEGTRDGDVALVGSLDDTIRMMDGRDGKCLQSFRRDQSHDAGRRGGGVVDYVNRELRLKSCFAVNEALVLAGSEKDGDVRAWDVMSGNVVGSVEVNSEEKVVTVVKWREGNKRAGREGVWAAGGVDGLVRVYGRSPGDT